MALTKIPFSLRLVSDGEPGTGLGTHLIDELVSRDHKGLPVITRSHLKGIARDRFAETASLRGWPQSIIDCLFGTKGADGNDGELGRLEISEARFVRSPATAPVGRTSRTALNKWGVAHRTSLRTTEAMAVGTEFSGELRFSAPEDSILAMAAKLSLIQVDGVGSKRTRGCGACIVTIAGDPQPSDLLKQLDKALANGFSLPDMRSAIQPQIQYGSGPAVVMRVVFRADDPVCCSPAPTGSSNVLHGSVDIPASAVQGAILTRINDDIDPELASRLLADPRFRAWPLLPTQRLDDPGDPPPAVRVSLSHKMSKLPGDDGTYEFRDRIIQPYTWQSVDSQSPLKGVDGVIRVDSAATRSLWRSGDIPRMLRGHGVHGGSDGESRNLYSVSALAPMVFTGYVAVPPGIDELLIKTYSDCDHAAFGRSRTVRGSGHLSFAPATFDDVLSCQSSDASAIYVVQSPLLLPTHSKVGEAGDMLRHLVADAGWGDVVRADAQVDIRFGWNRRGLGEVIRGSNRQCAVAVIAPGSVFQLSAPLNSSGETLVRGIGGGRERGFGAVLPHPGIATQLMASRPVMTRLRSRDRAGEIGLDLWRLATDSRLSPSQIGQLAARVRNDRKSAVAWLENLQSQATAWKWHRWQPVHGRLVDLLGDPNIEDMVRPLRVWQDLTIANQGEVEK